MGVFWKWDVWMGKVVRILILRWLSEYRKVIGKAQDEGLYDVQHDMRSSVALCDRPSAGLAIIVDRRSSAYFNVIGAPPD